MKKQISITALLIIILCVCTVLSSCGTIGKSIKKSDNKADKADTVQDDQIDKNNINTDSDKKLDSDEAGKKDESVDAELSDVVDSLIYATINDEDISDLIVVTNNDELDTRTKYYTDSDVIRAMAKDDRLSILVKSDEISVYKFDKQSKIEYNVQVKNEMGDTSILNFTKIDGNWKLDIECMLTYAYIAVPRDVNIKLNGIEVDKSLIESKSEQDIYRIPNVLSGITALVEYETGLSDSYAKEIAVGVEKPTKVRYELSESDLEKILPAVEELWNNIKEAARNNDTATIQNSLADDAQVSVDALMTAFNEDEYDTSLMSFIKRSDDEAIAAENVCYLSGENTYMLNLLGKFNMANFSGFGAKTPTSYCWVEVENTDSGLKIRQASEDVWLKRVNAYSNDM